MTFTQLTDLHVYDNMLTGLSGKLPPNVEYMLLATNKFNGEHRGAARGGGGGGGGLGLGLGGR